MSETHSCIGCRYAHKRNSLLLCRRYPPTGDFQKYPPVLFDGWCGEFSEDVTVAYLRRSRQERPAR